MKKPIQKMRINTPHRSSLNSITDDAPDIEYIRPLIEFTKSNFINKKSVPPIFLYEKDGDVQPVRVPVQLINSEEGKNDLSNLIASAVSSFKPDSYCFISETWVYKLEELDSKEEAMKAVADFKKGIPSDKVTREEVVTFAVTKINSDASLDRWMGNMPINRGSDDSITSFDSVRWIKAAGAKKLEGRLFV